MLEVKVTNEVKALLGTEKLVNLGISKNQKLFGSRGYVSDLDHITDQHFQGCRKSACIFQMASTIFNLRF